MAVNKRHRTAKIQLMDSAGTLKAASIDCNIQGPTAEQITLDGGLIRYQLLVDPGVDLQNENFISILFWKGHSPDPALLYPVQGVHEDSEGRQAVRVGYIAGEIQ